MTQGPWGFDRRPDTSELQNPDLMLRIFAHDPGPDNDFTIAFVRDVDKATRESNARLLAAAPELLDALKGCVDGAVIPLKHALHPSGMFCTTCGVNSATEIHNRVCRVAIAEAVIAKAEGRS